MYAKSTNLTGMDETLKDIWNLVENKFQFPSLAYLYTYRIIVCTLLTAGTFVRARTKGKRFDPSHFPHIFIDEAASMQESIVLNLISALFQFFNFHQTF